MRPPSPWPLACGYALNGLSREVVLHNQHLEDCPNQHGRSSSEGLLLLQPRVPAFGIRFVNRTSHLLSLACRQLEWNHVSSWGPPTA